MADCVLSTQNRFYVDLESDYGAAPAITASNRIPAVKLGIRQEREIRRRRDKTGSRTDPDSQTVAQSTIFVAASIGPYFMLGLLATAWSV